MSANHTGFYWGLTSERDWYKTWAHWPPLKLVEAQCRKGTLRLRVRAFLLQQSLRLAMWNQVVNGPCSINDLIDHCFHSVWLFSCRWPEIESTVLFTVGQVVLVSNGLCIIKVGWKWNPQHSVWGFMETGLSHLCLSIL